MALAVDIGGTKLSACLVDDKGLIGEPVIAPTPQGGAQAVWATLAAVALAALDGRDVLGVGVGAAGPLDIAAGTLSPVNIPAWQRFPVVERLAGLVPGVPVRFAGDGNCAAAGEHWLGAGQGLDDVLVLVVSTGVGGGLIQHGRLRHGHTGNAGHLGHVVVDLNGERCPCGGTGCVESIASGPSMTAWALRQGWQPPPPGAASAITLADAARAGDPVAARAFERSAQALAAGIVSAAALGDLSRAIIGGGVAKAADLLLPPLHEHLRRYARLDFLRRLTVVPAALGTSAGLAGAAALILQPDRYAP